MSINICPCITKPSPPHLFSKIHQACYLLGKCDLLLFVTSLWTAATATTTASLPTTDFTAFLPACLLFSILRNQGITFSDTCLLCVICTHSLYPCTLLPTSMTTFLHKQSLPTHSANFTTSLLTFLRLW